MGTDRILRNSLDLGSEVVVIACNNLASSGRSRPGPYSKIESRSRQDRALSVPHLRARGARIFGFEFRDFASQIVQGALARRVIAAETDFRDGLGERDQFRRIFVEARGIAQRVFQERMEHEPSRVLTIGAKYRAYAGEREWSVAGMPTFRPVGERRAAPEIRPLRKAVANASSIRASSE
jgi:hypothetical protein